jgi:glycosyltransferase involved in cell wall biosynthesis
MSTPGREPSGHADGAAAGRAPRVSIIMPFLDPPQAFIEEAVDSVLQQTFTDWELLLVNDGSGAAATAVATRLAAAHGTRIRCLSHEGGVNRGIPTSRNLGLAHARGEMIAYLDSDDAWFPHKLEAQVRILDGKPHVDMVFGRSLYWRSWADGVEAEKDRPPPLRVRDRSELAHGAFLHRMLRAGVMVPCPSSILARAASVRAVGGFAESVSNLYEDQAFYARISLAGVVLACEDVWDRYRLHENSVIASATAQQANEARRQFLDWLAAYLDEIGCAHRPLRRTVRVERWAAALPHVPRGLRYLRKLAWLPGRLLQSLPRGSAPARPAVR